MGKQTLQQHVLGIFKRHGIISPLANEIVKELSTHYRFVRKARKRPANRLIGGQWAVHLKTGGWTWGGSFHPNLASITFHVKCLNAEKTKRTIVIKKERLAPFFVKKTRNAFMVFEQRSPKWAKPIATGCSTLKNAAQAIQKELLQKGVSMDVSEVLKILQSP